MESKDLKYIFVGIVAMGLAFAIYSFIGVINDFTDLPYLGNTTKDEQGNKVYHQIGEFKVVNQFGDTLTQDDMRGKIHVANFFFTSCPVICPKMTTNMKEGVQEKLKNIPELQFISFSIDPKRDSIQKMKKFAERFDIDESNWNFVVADKKDIYVLARNSYFLVAVEGTEERNDFIHSEQVALVDQNLHIRGFYDAMEEADMKQLKKDIIKLSKSNI